MQKELDFSKKKGSEHPDLPCEGSLKLSPPEWSGAGERHGVEGPGDRLGVGEPERLSLDDWGKPEEKLRLLCIGGGAVCFDSFLKMRRLVLDENNKLRCVNSLTV